MTKREVLEAALRGEGCLGKAADDEPVFVLVGHDLLAAESVRDWADRAEVRCRPAGKAIIEKIALARRDAIAMDKWPNRKLPD